MKFYFHLKFSAQIILIFSSLKNILPKPFQIILKTYLVGLILFSIFRLLQFVLEFKHVSSIPEDEQFGIILQSFLMGFRFDIVIVSYIMILPSFFLLLFYQFTTQYTIIQQITKTYIVTLFSISFIICGIDLTYFHHFFSRFSIAGLLWVDSPIFMLKMIVQEFDFWWVIIPIMISIYVFTKAVNKHIFKPYIFVNTHFTLKKRIGSLTISLLTIFVIFVGIRGRFESKSPIRVGTAYFSNYAFANQLGLNPVFTFLRSFLDAQKEKSQRIQFMDDNEALVFVKKILNRKGSEDNSIAQRIVPDTINHNPPNVIIVIMEAMSAMKMERFGNKDNITPFLDSIANNGISFDNVYSAGTHTFNGIYSTIFSFPAIFTKHPMKTVDIPKYNGIGTTLKNLGYSTVYFTTHDDQFDNVGGFLKGNDFEKIVSQKDFPNDKVQSTLGVPDDYLFEYAVPKLNELNQKGKPFLSIMMTASDHGPYVIPAYFTPKSKEIKKQIVEYADWSIRKFITEAKKQSWFKNTLFAFVADHGAFMDAQYDVPLSYNHVPFIIYAPEIIKTPATLENFGSQVDVFPTIMNLLALPYTNNTLGVDLFTHKRPFTYFCNDDKLAVINEEYLFIYRKNSNHSLYKYKETDVTDHIKLNSALTDSMKTYAFSQMQTAQYLIEKKMTNR